MITFLYGRSGAGKSRRISETIEQALSAGKKVILLCPEQEAVIAEERLTARLAGRVPTVDLEILNFGRLPERVFREYGGMTETELAAGGRRLILRRALTEAAPFLKEYGQAAGDRAMIDRLLAQIAEFKMCRIGVHDLEAAAADLSEAQTRLKDKLNDFALLYAVYERLLHKEYSDPQDALDRLVSLLDGVGRGFFRGKTVFLDGFNGFTAQQYAVIYRIFENADDCTVSLCCLPDGEREWMLRRVYETESILFRLVRELGTEVHIVTLRENRRTSSPALLRVSEELFSVGECEKTESGGDVRVFSCRDPFAEAEAVAEDIRKRVLGGSRYREITVILRGAERYEGILDAVFEKYEIPCYMAKRSAASSKPFFRYLHGLFQLYTCRFRRQDVIGLLKTGLTDIPEDDAFLFENYITAWNLSGSRFDTDSPWTMNPAGFREKTEERDKEVLARVNAVRESLLSMLAPFYDRLRENAKTMTVRDISAWLWEHLDMNGIPEKLLAYAERERAYGDISGAEETEQLWDVFVGLLDSLVTVAGDVPCLVSEYVELLDLVLSDVTIGSIPARCDEVVIGDASLLRPDNARHVYLVGCTDGVFPMSPAEDSIFSDRDKKLLAEHGVKLSETGSERTQDEYFHFWFACAAARETLTVSYPCADLSGSAFRPSPGAERMTALFSDVVPYDPGQCAPEERLSAPDAGFETMAYLRAEPLGQALYDYYTAHAEENERYARWLVSFRQPLVERRNRLEKGTAESLFGDRINMTQSRLEKYVMCHFSFFCDYVLKLEERKRVSFGSADIGTFIHYVLERFMELYAQDEDREKYQDDTYLEALIGELISDYTRTLGDAVRGAQAGRVRHLLARLQKTAVVTVKNLMHEFAESDFLPRDFELNVGADDGSSIPALKIQTPTGQEIRLYGKIDRVDTYEKDGKTYIRVVDYKSYVKKFSLDDVAAGVNMQMLLYLFSVWKNGGGRYAGELVPAGVLYMSANPAEQTHNTVPTGAEAEQRSEDELKRSGLFLDDRDVLEAMEHGLGGKYIPVKLNKDGSYRKGTPVETLERFGQLEGELEQTICALTDAMRAGNADALPISRKNPETGLDPCEYCQMKPVCRAL